MKPRPALVTLAVFGGFAALSIYETAQAIDAPRRVATDADWVAAAAELRAGYRPGDLIVFAPGWVDPLGRQHLGDLVTPAMAGRSDSDGWGRIWEVSIRGARAPETLARATDSAPSRSGRRERSPHPRQEPQLISAHPHGRVRVALYRKTPPVPALYDFTAHFADARVTQAPADGRGDEKPCPRQDGAFRCAGVTVEPRTLEIDYRPRRGILAPVDGNLVTRLEFRDVPLGAGLMLYAGIHDFYSRKNADGAVDFGWAIDDRPIAWTKIANDDGWAAIPVPQRAAGDHTVRFEIKAAAAALRTFGFHAETRPTVETAP